MRESVQVLPLPFAGSERRDLRVSLPAISFLLFAPALPLNNLVQRSGGRLRLATSCRSTAAALRKNAHVDAEDMRSHIGQDLDRVRNLAHVNAEVTRDVVGGIADFHINQSRLLTEGGRREGK